MQRLIFDFSPIYFVLCVALGFGYAWLLYTSRYTWSRNLNRFLFALRAVLASALLILLMGPVLRQTSNIFERPTLVFLVDNSRSVGATTDTVRLLEDLRKASNELSTADRDVEWSNLDGPTEKIHFTNGTSDLSLALKQVSGRHEGKNLAGIVLVSDGIYNNGMSPLYMPLRVPVYTVAVGDSTQRSDIVLRNVAYNRVVYQGNKYPLRAEIGITGLSNEDITVTVQQKGKILQKVTKNTSNKSLMDIDFQLDAVTQGIQRLEIRVNQNPKESNVANNRATAFVEVVEGKKKILIVASSPHPDIKALRTVVEKNSNYETRVHLVGIKEQPPAALNAREIDLLIAHQSPDQDSKTTGLMTSLLRAKVPALIIVGHRTHLRALSPTGAPVSFEPSSQRDEVQPVLNVAFQDFGFSSELNSLIARFPPVSIPFGKMTYPAEIKPILFQRIGSLATERPMLFTVDQDEHKLAVLVGDGIWKWRLNEFQETGKPQGFDELFTKLIQYLSTQDDRKKFRSFPLQHEFTRDGPVVIESQVYNDLFEPVYGNTVEIELRDESGKASAYRYVIGPGSSSRYRIGGLEEGIYRYTSSTEIKGRRETVKGEFLVVEQSQESRNLTADFGLLRKLAYGTDGAFYNASEISKLSADLSKVEAKTTIHTEENFNPLINIKLFFFLLLFLISVEWFVRKFAGAY